MDSAGGDTGLQTPRLSLRRPGVADVDVVLRLHQDPLAVAHNAGDALADRPATQRLLQRWSDHWARHGVGYWAVSWRDDPEVLGFCGVKVMTLHARLVSNLFYRLDPCAWGQGIGSEAAAAVVEWSLQRHPGRPVITRVRPANHTSARVALKAGSPGPQSSTASARTGRTGSSHHRAGRSPDATLQGDPRARC